MLLVQGPRLPVRRWLERFPASGDSLQPGLDSCGRALHESNKPRAGEAYDNFLTVMFAEAHARSKK